MIFCFMRLSEFKNCYKDVVVLIRKLVWLGIGLVRFGSMGVIMFVFGIRYVVGCWIWFMLLLLVFFRLFFRSVGFC